MSVERQSGRDLELVWVETTGAAAPAAPERFRPDDESTWPAEGEPCAAVADMLGLALVQVLDPRTRAPQSSTLMARTVGGLAPVRCCPGCGVEVPS